MWRKLLCVKGILTTTLLLCWLVPPVAHATEETRFCESVPKPVEAFVINLILSEKGQSPTPTLAQRYTKQRCAAIKAAHIHFQDRWQQALCIMFAESSGIATMETPEPSGSRSYGIFQIHFRDHGKAFMDRFAITTENLAIAGLLDPMINASYARVIFDIALQRGKKPWQPWYGDYQRYPNCIPHFN